MWEANPVRQKQIGGLDNQFGKNNRPGVKLRVSHVPSGKWQPEDDPSLVIRVR